MAKDPELDRLMTLLEIFVGDGAATIGGATTSANVGAFPVPLGAPLRSPDLIKSRSKKKRKAKRIEQ